MEDTEQIIQKLWSGYGKLSRKIENGKSIITKQVQFPLKIEHPRDWNSTLSHQRKVKSYQVEINWYRDYNLSVKYALTAQYISSKHQENGMTLKLEDLRDRGFVPKQSIDNKEVKSCLRWLAYFHAFHLERETKGLWETGTYWHLKTRPEEFEAIKDLNLKEKAVKLDLLLEKAQYKTIVHGDAKLANFLFYKNQVCAVDFQYTGGGVGVKDLAYFLGSIYGGEDLFEQENESLSYYFDTLIEALKFYHPDVDPLPIQKEWSELYPIACCDFYRFLKGWSPNHKKLNSYSQHILTRTLKCL